MNEYSGEVASFMRMIDIGETGLARCYLSERPEIIDDIPVFYLQRVGQEDTRRVDRSFGFLRILIERLEEDRW